MTWSWPDKGNMPCKRKRLLGYVETIQLILGVTDNYKYMYLDYVVVTETWWDRYTINNTV